ncbi:hypothetical protein ACTJJ0_22580 [Chitinophaga sp. 22321]|uniref:hypothetical protein n=1 Tax=Chitinophaga TaxID=79328 RepID=UPI003F69FD64
MNTYFKMIADRVMLKKDPEKVPLTRQTSDDDTKELIALMDNIPNAKSVAAAYRQMIRTGSLEQRFRTGDPGRSWLEIEQMILSRECRRKGNRRKIIRMVIIFALVGIASYFGGVYLLAKGKFMAVQVVK